MRLSLLSPILPSLCPVKFTLGGKAHCGLAMSTKLPRTAGMKAACCHWGFAFTPSVCTPTPAPAFSKETSPPQAKPKTWLKSFVIWQEAISQGRARDRGGSRLQDARALFSAGQANNPVLNYKPGFSCGCFVFVGFFVSCLFRFISVIPDTALSDIITIISLLCLPGNWEASRRRLQSRAVVGPGLPARHSPRTAPPELGALGKVEAQALSMRLKSQKQQGHTEGQGIQSPARQVSIPPTISVRRRDTSGKGEGAHRKTWRMWGSWKRAAFVLALIPPLNSW